MLPPPPLPSLSPPPSPLSVVASCSLCSPLLSFLPDFPGRFRASRSRSGRDELCWLLRRAVGLPVLGWRPARGKLRFFPYLLLPPWRASVFLYLPFGFSLDFAGKVSSCRMSEKPQVPEFRR